MTHDERRARVVLAIISEDLDGVKPWEDLDAIQIEALTKIARAIRASDEAAGMVLVPRHAMTLIESMIDNPVTAYSVHALDGMFGMIRDALAATEADNG